MKSLRVAANNKDLSYEHECGVFDYLVEHSQTSSVGQRRDKGVTGCVLSRES